jgi:hypothetical protein
MVITQMPAQLGDTLIKHAIKINSLCSGRESPDHDSVALEEHGVLSCPSCIEDNVETGSVLRFRDGRSLNLYDVITHHIDAKEDTLARMHNWFALQKKICFREFKKPVILSTKIFRSKKFSKKVRKF